MRKIKGRVPDGRVFDIRDVMAEIQYIHPDYEYVLGDGSLAEDDRLIVFRLKPRRTELPSFVGRWDGGNRSIPTKIKYELDIDIEGVSDEEVRQFKHCKNGYGGHHTARIGGENRYEVDLKTPAGPVFDAFISFTKHHAQGLNISASASVTVNTRSYCPLFFRKR